MQCLGAGNHCAECKRIVALVAGSYKQAKLPGLIVHDRCSKDQTVEELAAFAHEIESKATPQDEQHQHLAAIVSTFLQRSRSAYLTRTMGSNGYFIAHGYRK